MYLYFGIVKNYLPEKGFGFLTHPIGLGPDFDVFFHISNVKKHKEITAENLSNYESSYKICFWYISEKTYKGEQLKKILSPSEVFNLQQENSADFVNKIGIIWKNIEKPVPFWLSEVTIGLLGTDGNEELKSEREILIRKKHVEQEKNHEAQERLRKIEEEKAKLELEKREEERRNYEKKIAEERIKFEEERKLQKEKEEQLQKTKEEEFELLVAEMKSKGFTQSAEVSNYIVRCRLGDKYQNISGILEMTNGGETWDFNGGFPPRIYAMLCERLHLGNKGTDAKVVGFTSFKDLKNKT
ncbi:MAG: cold shock domain-containing protein [Saprospiraceae bacterium]|nr:cold shock domain-containing protein [Saprospiraceae bacterium]